MAKRFLLSAALAFAGAAAFTAPAQATNLVQNGDFTGATWLYGPSAGSPATTFVFEPHTYLGNFAWLDTGSGALDFIAPSGSAIQAQLDSRFQFYPANPGGYTGSIYAADASAEPYNTNRYLFQTLNGLTVGQKYTVSFQQAAGGFYNGASNPQWNESAQWVVGWGGAPQNSNTQLDLTGAVTQSSALMNVDPGTGAAPWQKQSLTFTATSTSELLSFFASGSGAPPFALLAGVSVNAVPEPASWALMIGGLGFAAVLLRRRRAALAEDTLAKA